MALTRPSTGARLEQFLAELTLGPPRRGDAALILSRRLVDELGHPQDHARQVHVVGTAGKGTAAAAVTAAAVPSATVVTHMSPHVYDVRERFLANGRLPDWDAVTEAAEEVHDAVEVVKLSAGDPPTFFAATAAIAWVMGRNAGVDLQVTEAGIGGRFDATNVMTGDDRITVVTTIGVDHIDVLGSDVRSIARQKASVAPDGGVLIVGPQPHFDALDEVSDVAAERDARMVVLDQTVTDWRGAAIDIARAVAVELGLSVAEGERFALPPGRDERLHLDGRSLILDGAHNPLKLEAALASVRPPPGDLIAVVAVGSGKDLDECVAAVGRHVDRVVATEFGDSTDAGSHPRSWPAGATAAAFTARGTTVVAVEPDPAAAVDAALDVSGADDGIVVTGSFFHLAAARARLLALGAVGRDVGPVVLSRRRGGA